MANSNQDPQNSSNGDAPSTSSNTQPNNQLSNGVSTVALRDSRFTTIKNKIAAKLSSKTIWDLVKENCTPGRLEASLTADNVNRSDYGQTALYFAVVNNNKALVECLLRNGANKNYSCFPRWNLLKLLGGYFSYQWVYFFQLPLALPVAFFAAALGFTDIVKLLVTDVDDLTQKDSQNQTVLHYAAGGDHSKMIEELFSLAEQLDHPLDVDPINDKHHTPLYIAASFGYLEVVKLFLDKNAQLFYEHKFPYTFFNTLVLEEALTCKSILNASIEGHYTEEVMEALIKAAVPVNKAITLDSPLRSAIRIGNEAAIKMLLRQGASAINELYYANGRGKYDAVFYLIVNAVENINESDRIDEKNAMHAASGDVGNGYKKMQALIVRGANIHVKDIQGRTPILTAFIDTSFRNYRFHYQIRRLNPCLRVLLRTLDSELINNDLEKYLSSLEAFFISEESQWIRHLGAGFLHWAAAMGHDEIIGDIVRSYEKYGLSINDKDCEGKTARHYAIENKHEDVRHKLNSHLSLLELSFFALTNSYKKRDGKVTCKVQIKDGEELDAHTYYDQKRKMIVFNTAGGDGSIDKLPNNLQEKLDARMSLGWRRGN